MSTSFRIEGMHCAGCVGTVEGALKKVPGVTSAAVNLASSKATVQGTAETGALVAAVAASGYKAIPLTNTAAQHETLGELDRKRLVEVRNRVIIAAAFTIPVVILGMSHAEFSGSGLIQLLLTLPVLWMGRGFFTGAAKLAVKLQSNMDTLVAMGTGTAFIYSVASWALDRHDLYFEAAAVIVTLILLGKYLEERAKAGTGGALRKLIGLQPKMARLVRGSVETEVPLEEIQPADILIVRPGEKIPVDGVIVDGKTTVNEAMVTGESMPVTRIAGDKVIGGTVNGAGAFRMSAEKVGSDTLLARIIRMVEDAQGSKAPIQRLADRVASRFVPAVLAIALVTLGGWLATGHSFTEAIFPTVAVLLIACPCALGLATPTGIMAGTGRAAEQGILIRNAEALELAGNLRALIFDKTGTLTEGRPEVTDFISLGGTDAAAALRLIASAERLSEHPLAAAIVRHASREHVTLAEAREFQTFTGLGVRAIVDGVVVSVGKDSSADEEANRLRTEGKTVVSASLDGKPSALIAIADPIRKNSRAALGELRAMGLHLVMVTGDNPITAAAIARAVGIDAVVAGASPEGKVEEVDALKKKFPVVGMVGDGINDAPALAKADVSFAIGGGTDIAMETASATLIHGDLAKVAEAVRVSRLTMRIIRQNLFFAFLYNVLAIPLAALGLLSPMIASGAMALSSVTVVTNALRLKVAK